MHYLLIAILSTLAVMVLVALLWWFMRPVKADANESAEVIVEVINDSRHPEEEIDCEDVSEYEDVVYFDPVNSRYVGSVQELMGGPSCVQIIASMPPPSEENPSATITEIPPPPPSPVRPKKTARARKAKTPKVTEGVVPLDPNPEEDPKPVQHTEEEEE